MRIAILLLSTFWITPAFAEGVEKANITQQGGFLIGLESFFGDYLVSPLASVLFFDVAFFTDSVKIPFIVLWLVIGAVFLTIRMSFINLRAFRHAIHVTAGKYDNPNDPGEINHFQALSSALSATVGLGNIAGVAVAVGLGGPGAIFWMIVAGFLGMCSKFVESTLGQMYRRVGDDGKVLGGPMKYISEGMRERGMPRAGKGLAALFAVMCIGGSLGGGNMFQANQSLAAISGVFPAVEPYRWLFGIILAAFVGIVIFGGIRRIGGAAGVIVPFMCVLYLLGGIFILATHASAIPSAFALIFSEAFSPMAGYGGLIGVLVIGFQRAAFSNEAGIGSAAIAHSAASTTEPVREGIVALLGPFIDTIVICTMTGLIVIVTGTYTGEYGDGVLMTSAAYGTTLSWFPNILSMAVLLFAFSTMISWSYYGERSWVYLFGKKTLLAYRLIFLVFVFLGSVFSLTHVLDFSDLMILGMAFPNMLMLVLLSGKVRRSLDEYWHRYKSGEMLPTAEQSHEVLGQARRSQAGERAS